MASEFENPTTPLSPSTSSHPSPSFQLQEGNLPYDSVEETRDRVQKKPRGKAGQKPFPLIPFSEAIGLPNAIQEHAAGQRVRRLTLFDKMGKSPGSGTSRALITNAQRYGLISGNYNSEYLELTQDGFALTSLETSARDKIRLGFEMAILSNEVLKGLYDRLANKKFPSDEVMLDMAGELGVDEADRRLCVDIFINNIEYLGLQKILSGSKMLVSIEHAIEEIPVDTAPVPPSKKVERTITKEEGVPRKASAADGDFANLCFFIAPIGLEGEEERKHSDMMLEAFIEKAIKDTGLSVVRADKITTPGMISNQVIEHLLKAKVVVADLSFHNPNVFYELAIRHMTGLPTVHIIRSKDRIPFDIANFRTVTIDTSDMYELVRKLEKYQGEIKKQIHKAIEEPKTVTSNPIIAFVPGLKDKILCFEKG
jgi:hypothetical protein